MAGPGTRQKTAAKPLVRSERAAAIAAVLATVFGAVLIVWAAYEQSFVMAAGGILSIARGIMGALIIAGIHLSRRHTKEFPDGLYKVENIIAVALGVIVLVLTYEIARLSIMHLGGKYTFIPDPEHTLPFFIAAAILAVVMGFYKRRVAKAEGCPSLLADSFFSFADAAALLIIGVALTIDIAGYQRVDAIAGLLVACLLLVIGLRILFSGLKVLLDASVDRDTLSKVRAVAKADPDIRKVLAVDGRNSGSFIFLHVSAVPAAYDVDQAGRIARELERRIKAAIPNVDRVNIEFSEPEDFFTVAVPIASDEKSIGTGFESTPKIGLIEIDSGAVSGEPEIIDNPALGKSSGGGVHLAVYLGRRPVEVLLTKEDLADEDTLQTLEAYAIDISTKPTLADLESTAVVLAEIAGARKPAASGPGAGGKEVGGKDAGGVDQADPAGGQAGGVDQADPAGGQAGEQ